MLLGGMMHEKALVAGVSLETRDLAKIASWREALRCGRQFLRLSHHDWFEPSACP
jgi:hypothetical protein